MVARRSRTCCVCHQPVEDQDQILLCIVFNEPHHHKECQPRPDQTRIHPEGNEPVPDMDLAKMRLPRLATKYLQFIGIGRLSQLRAQSVASLRAAGCSAKTINDVQDWLLDHALSLLPDESGDYLKEMDLSVRSFNNLLRSGLTSLSLIRAESRDHLEALTGPKTVAEVQRYLADHDLPLLNHV